MIADSVGVPRGAGQARDLRRRALLRRLPRRRRLRAALPARGRRGGRRERDALRHQRLVAAARRSPRPPRASSRELGDACRSASTRTTTPAAAWRTRSSPSSAGARLVQGTMNGYGERCGNANLVSILPALAAEDGLRVRRRRSSCARLTETAHLVDEICNVTPEPEPALRRAQRVRAQGRHARGRRQRATRARSSTSTRRTWATDRALLVSELSGKGTVQARAEQRASSSTTRGRARGRARQGARAPRLPLRGRRRLVRPADPQGDGRLRAAVPARVVARDRREARGRPRRDRGHDQDLGGRRALRAHRRGQRPGARARPRAARRDRRALPAPARHRARRTSRCASSTRRRAPARSRACCSTPATASRPGARSACPRTSSRRAGRRSSTRSRPGMLPGARRAHAPRAGRAGVSDAASRSRGRSIGAARGGAGARGAALGAAVARADAAASSSSALAELARRRRTCRRCRAAPPGCTSRSARPASRRATRSSPRRSSFVASANCLLYEDARPVFCDIDPRTLNIDPAAAAAAVTERTTGLLPVHIFGYPADMPALRARWPPSAACGSSRTPARRSAPSTPTARRSGARGNLAVFAFYPNKQITTGEGGAVVCPDAGRQGAHRLRAQPGPRAGHGLARPRPARLQLPPRRPRPARSGVAQLERLDELLAGARARGRRSTREALAGRRGARAALPGRGRRPAQLVRLRGPAAARASTATPRSRRCASAGVDSKPYLPAIHLMSFYRERFGHREGEFPVCEDVARRSLALPFFPRADRGRGGAGGRRRCAR